MTTQRPSTRQIILEAADHIVRNPKEFNYDEMHRHFTGTLSVAIWNITGKETPPPDCNSPCCALGWMGVFYGETPDEETESLDERAMRILGVTYWTGFEQRMDLIDRTWGISAARCAAALRVYADRYHPADVRRPASPLPDWNALAMGTDLLSV